MAKKIHYMEDSLDFCLYDYEIAERYGGQEVIVLATDEDGKAFRHRFHQVLGLRIFSYQWETQQFSDGESYPLKALKSMRNAEVIFIASERFWDRIVEQLEQEGYVLGKDIFFWEQRWPLDENVQAFIRHNEAVWGKRKRVGKQNKILIPFDFLHDVNMVALSYCADYLAEQHDAEIWCYLRYGSENMLMYKNKSVRDVYQSINVTHILDMWLYQDQEIKARRMLETVWEKLYTWQDLKELELFGMNVGISIIRDYLRFYLPELEIRTESFKGLLLFYLQMILFWHDYFEEHQDIKAVILWDGVCRESFLRDAAIQHGIPVYAIHYSGAVKCTMNFHFGKEFKHYREFFSQLTEREKVDGMAWAKTRLEARLRGDISDISFMKQSIYTVPKRARVLDETDKLKVLICPHAFVDDLYCFGDQIFGSVVEWLGYLGEMSERTDYEWYLKLHPIADERDEEIVGRILKKFPNIRRIPTLTSPYQLKEEGLNFALTVWGTIGHEYPLLGIQVINAGNNPHIAYDFDWNPRTREEYEELLLHLEKLHKKTDLNEMERFYCIQFLYYAHPGRGRQDVFFQHPENFPEPTGKPMSEAEFTGRYRSYLEEWTPEWHEQTKKNVRQLFHEMDQWKEDVFYRRKR